MSDTDPQREGETLQRGYPDPSVLGGKVGLWMGSRALNPMPAPQAKQAAAEVEELGYAALGSARPKAGRRSPTPRCSSVPRAAWS